MDTPPLDPGTEWAPVVVAIAVLAMVSLIIIVAILKYPANEVSKPISAMMGVLGGLLGTIGTYYFEGARHQVEQGQLQTRIDQAVAKVTVVMGHANTDHNDLLEDYQELERDIKTVRERAADDFNDLFEDYQELDTKKQDLDDENQSLRERLNALPSLP